jgi:DNA polymerase III epsilon subunit-like protein
MLLAGLDIETTGLEPAQGHRLIQIGIYTLDTITGVSHTYSSDVQPVGKIRYDPEALKVNKFTKRRVENAPQQYSVDTILWQDMLRDGYQHDSLIPVGWNVISFDLMFIARELPLLKNMFRYGNPEHSNEAIDLNGLALYYSFKLGMDYKQLKREIKDRAAGLLGEQNEHDALYDAHAAIAALTVFRGFEQCESI